MNIVKQNMLMTNELINVTKLLKENGIESIAFKGPVLSHLAYGDVVSRQYVDLDILVDKSLLIKTQDILESNNYFQKYKLEEYQKEKLKDVVHDISFTNKKNNVDIELHWTLSSGEFFIDLEKLNYLEDIKKYYINNSEVNIFLNEKLFIYLCVHGYKHLWERIEWLVDIYYLLEKNNLNIEKIIKMSREIDSDRIVLSTLVICQKLFGFTVKLKNILDEDYNLITKSNHFYDKLIKDYCLNNNNNNNREISFSQFYMLKSFSYRKKYVISFFIPTQKDFEVIKLPRFLYFIYYLIRPINIIIRYFKD